MEKNRRGIYWLAWLVSWRLLMAGAYGGLALAGWLASGDASHFARFAGALVVPAFLFSRGIATVFCRRIGLSLESHQWEHLRRTDTSPAVGDARPVQAGARRFVVGAGIVTGLMSMGAWFLMRSASVPPDDRIFVALSPVLFGLASAACWYACFTGAGLAVVADEHGVGERPFFGRAEVLPWREIAGCSIHTQRDVLGRASGTECHLYGRDGLPALVVSLDSSIPEAQRRAFLAAVRVHQGAPPETPTELIAGTAPAGLGTEMEAAAAPAGPGVEVEAAAEDPAAEAGSRWLRAIRAGRG